MLLPTMCVALPRYMDSVSLFAAEYNLICTSQTCFLI